MRVLVITDIEGIAGVDSIDMIDESTDGYRRACEYLMADTNAAVDGAFAGGATEVIVVDGHGGGDNFLEGLLDPRAILLPAKEFSKNTPTDFDALLCVGSHAMAGTENAFLDHTRNSTKWFEFLIDGVAQGELSIQGYCMGQFGVPLVMVSGDEAVCREAQAFVPSIATACVKTANGRNQATSLPADEARALIRDAARDGVARCKEILPLTLSLPVEIQLTFCRNDYCDQAMHEGLERHGRTLKKTLEKIECYADLVKL
jgi:D-amino peptidase